MKTLALLSIWLALPLCAQVVSKAVAPQTVPQAERTVPTPEELADMSLKYMEAQAAQITLLQNWITALSINPKNQGSDADKQALDKASKEVQEYMDSIRTKHHAEKCNWAFAAKQWVCPEAK